MNCARFAKILADYQEGKISAAERERVERHLEQCLSCQKLLEIACGSVDILPADMQEGLARAILDRTSGGPVCPRVESSLWEYAAGRQSPEESQLISLHLDHCANCRAAAADLDLIQETLPTLAEIDPGESFTREVIRATSGMRRHRPGLKSHMVGWWNRMVQRPRFALESAYVCTVLLLFVLSPFLPFRHLVLQTIPSKAIDPSARYAASVLDATQISIAGQAGQLESALVSGTVAVYGMVEQATGRAVHGSSSILYESLERIGGWHRKEADSIVAFWNRLSGRISGTRP
jgi:anti-sigma factor RsiW